MPLENLSIGAFGGDVHTVHERLRQHGFVLPSAEVAREFFGPETRDAVCDLQRKYGLKVTGAIDTATSIALQGPAAGVVNVPPPAAPVVSVPSSNGNGSNGSATANGVSQPRPPERRVSNGSRSSDYAARDNEARVTFYVLLWKRKGISLPSFDDYWRDVHGPVCARLPGQFQYWQFHVGHNQGGTFPDVDRVNYTTADDEQFDGIAELTFRSVADRETWFTASAILMDDEHNIFSKAIGYVTEQGNSRTYVDAIPTGDPNGDLDIIKFHVMVQQRPGVSSDDFRRYMTDTFAANATRNSHLLKFRLHLFEPPDTSRPDAAGVVHIESPMKQYQAAFEIAFRNHLEMEMFFASPDYANALTDQAKYVKIINPMPERNAYAFVYSGRMTLAGERGSRTAELITALGATNQLRDDIHDLVVGAGYESSTKPTSSNGGGYSQGSNARGARHTLAQVFSEFDRD